MISFGANNFQPKKPRAQGQGALYGGLAYWQPIRLAAALRSYFQFFYFCVSFSVVRQGLATGSPTFLFSGQGNTRKFLLFLNSFHGIFVHLVIKMFELNVKTFVTMATPD